LSLSTAPLKGEEALLDVAEQATHDTSQKANSDVEGVIVHSRGNDREEQAPGVDEYAFEETNGDKASPNNRIESKRNNEEKQACCFFKVCPWCYDEHAFEEINEEVKDNQLVARKSTNVAANIEFQKDYSSITGDVDSSEESTPNLCCKIRPILVAMWKVSRTTMTPPNVVLWLFQVQMPSIC
jgi:hypothetical protein